MRQVEVIGLFTNRIFNHVSLSLTEICRRSAIIDGEKIKPPGPNPELLEHLTEKTGTSCMIKLTSLRRTVNRKKTMLDKVQEINNEGKRL